MVLETADVASFSPHGEWDFPYIPYMLFLFVMLSMSGSLPNCLPLFFSASNLCIHLHDGARDTKVSEPDSCHGLIDTILFRARDLQRYANEVSASRV